MRAFALALIIAVTVALTPAPAHADDPQCPAGSSWDNVLRRCR